MANSNAPFGFGSLTRTGSEYVGGLNRYYIPATDGAIMAVGDPVVGAGSADSDGVQTVTRAAAADAVLGYIVGFDPVSRDQEDLPSYKPASTETYVLVSEDPGSVVILQEDSVGGALAAVDSGLNVDFIVANANSVTGQSQVQIDSSTKATTNTLPLKLQGLYQTENNEFGANAIWVCTFNTHALKADTGSTGT